jgi:hypothetical protein
VGLAKMIMADLEVANLDKARPRNLRILGFFLVFFCTFLAEEFFFGKECSVVPCKWHNLFAKMFIPFVVILLIYFVDLLFCGIAFAVD